MKKKDKISFLPGVARKVCDTSYTQLNNVS